METRSMISLVLKKENTRKRSQGSRSSRKVVKEWYSASLHVSLIQLRWSISALTVLLRNSLLHFLFLVKFRDRASARHQIRMNCKGIRSIMVEASVELAKESRLFLRKQKKLALVCLLRTRIITMRKKRIIQMRRKQEARTLRINLGSKV